VALSSQTQRSLLLSFIGSLAACGLVGIYTLVFGSFGSLEFKILGTTAALGGASILAMAAAVAWESRRWHPIGVFGMAAPAVALVLVLLAIWDVAPRVWGSWYERLMASAGVLAIGFPHVCLLALARLHRGYEWVRVGTVAVIALLAALILWIIWRDPSDSDLLGRVLGTLAILDACGSVAVPILHRVSGIRERQAVLTTGLSITLTCPRCGKAQTLPTGHARCECGLRIRIEIEEEHCPKCGYALYKLPSGVCPECGTPVASE
jgi:hypothetical protein